MVKFFKMPRVRDNAGSAELRNAVNRMSEEVEKLQRELESKIAELQEKIKELEG